jgi:hypothetical protein
MTLPELSSFEKPWDGFKILPWLQFFKSKSAGPAGEFGLGFA